MTTPAQDRFHLHRAFITDAAADWTRKLQYGVPEIGWDGDSGLMIAHHIIKDSIEVWHQLPGGKPTLCLQVPFAEWDVNKACARLRDADGRKHSFEDRLVEVDRHNEERERAKAKAERERREHVNAKVQWAIQKDTDRGRKLVSF